VVVAEGSELDPPSASSETGERASWRGSSHPVPASDTMDVQGALAVVEDGGWPRRIPRDAMGEERALRARMVVSAEVTVGVRRLVEG
jgi:hypothetical protein